MDEKLILHEDYENFANYLGIDYEDYLELIGDYEISLDDVDFAMNY